MEFEIPENGYHGKEIITLADTLYKTYKYLSLRYIMFK
jgi:hypothetical protein